MASVPLITTTLTPKGVLTGINIKPLAFNLLNRMLLDSVSSPASAAYSLRKLSTSYNGACVRVRRSSDNSETDIGFAGSSLDTTSLLSFVGISSGFVTTWYDQSGNGRNATQTIAAIQPRLVNAGVLDTINSCASLRLSGAQSFNQTFSHSGTFAINAVVLATSLNAGIVQIGALNEAGSLILEGGFWYARPSGGALSSAIAYPGSVLTQLFATYANLNTNVFQKKVAGTRDTSSPTLTASNLVGTIGSLATIYYLTGYLSEVVMFNSAVSDQDRIFISDNQLAFYNIP